MESVAAIFQTLADPTRSKILLMLSNGERGVTSIFTELKSPQPTVSHHLGLLRTAGFVQAVRKGKEIIYTLDPIVTITGKIFRIGPVEIISKKQPWNRDSKAKSQGTS